uniref:Uncharacterized protein n=1 Tax=Oryza nivara TaxID=4536 RepID=A0A0E0I8S0_ORYNI
MSTLLPLRPAPSSAPPKVERHRRGEGRGCRRGEGRGHRRGEFVAEVAEWGDAEGGGAHRKGTGVAANDDLSNCTLEKDRAEMAAEEVVEAAMENVLNKVYDEVMEEEVVGQGVGMEENNLSATIERGEKAKEEEQILMAANVSEVVTTPTRASSRLASMDDAHVVEKAGKRKAWKNLESDLLNIGIQQTNRSE